MSGQIANELEACMRMPPQLPSEVWGVISDRLNADDWARACGTCKASAAVN